MNCQQFALRLQQTLDDRRSPESDFRLRDHASHCVDCQRQLQAWQQIARVIPRQSDRRRRGLLTACGLAAAVLVAVVLRLSFAAPDGQGAVAQASLSNAPSSIAGHEVDAAASLIAADVDPTNWWRQVHGRDWFGETMPAVRRVREGVAPLGRSLLQAVTILTIGGGGRTT